MLLGVDIADVSRFEDVKKSFLDKCFTPDEQLLFTGKNRSERIAVNFAAKEALSKAFGTGVRGFEHKDIEVLRDELGKPYFRFGERIKKILDGMGAVDVSVSLSHDGGMAVATVVVCTDNVKSKISKIIQKTNTDNENIISYSRVKSSIPCRKVNTHKGDYGRIFIVAGSKGLTGAAIMASKAALRSGGGLITLGCADCLNNIFEVCLHEVMTLPLADDGNGITRYSAGAVVDKANKSSVLLFGCGLSDTQDVYAVLKSVLRNVEIPVVIDADGINALSRNINILKTAKCPVVLTPHIGEFSRLTGHSAEEIMADKERIASDFAKEYGVTLVLKSHETIVAYSDGRVRRNILGNPGMATGGSGDVLAGAIASFIGQGIDNAVECGVYVHSLAGDISSLDKGEYGMTPTDIIENFPYAIDYILRGE